MSHRDEDDPLSRVMFVNEREQPETRISISNKDILCELKKEF